MKKYSRIIWFSLFLTSAFLSPVNTQAQTPIAEIIKQGIKKVIKAVDLKIQRLQNKTIWLQNAQKVLENKLSELKLTEISEWTERQRELYAKYFEELWKVKTAITYYEKVKEITKKQKGLVEAYGIAFSQFRQDPNFSPEEIEYMYQAYSGIIDESVQNLDQVMLVIEAFTTQMSDAKRLEIIDDVNRNLDQNISDLRAFNSQNIKLSFQRASERNNLKAIQELYGILNKD